MASVTDFGGTSDTLASPALGGASGWAAAVAAALNSDDTTVNDRIDGVRGFNLTKAGVWVAPGGNAVPSLMTAGRMSGGLYPVYQAHTLDRIGVYTTVVGSAGSVIRLGVYRAAANGVDYTLVLDAGTVDSTTGPGALEIDINQSVTHGLYWLVAVAQGAPTTEPTAIMATSPSSVSHMMAAASLVNTMQTCTGLSTTGVTGALPASVTPYVGDPTARVAVKIA